jgi:hypothetical protein
MVVPRFTLRSLTVAIVISSLFTLAVREVGWVPTSFITIMFITPAIDMITWQKLGILGTVVGSLTSASWSVLYVSVAPGVVAPFVNALAVMMLWCFTQSVQPDTRLHTLIRQTKWGTISFVASLFLSMICFAIRARTFG